MSVTASPSQAIHQERDTNDQINSRMVMSVWRVFLHTARRKPTKFCMSCLNASPSPTARDSGLV
ncbi:hypothetical protein P389DRAFT_176311 [Cystobasidium minutum MCA 4210]|uniref:uncharacterized protein n=1 Tax=Cystobasidium minutum MCA 4210 TaxID=1397322 RepID=UPI0034CD968D|eukprot:jgi/Rhomi1/176311/fgenesh1_kg.12_\